MGFCGEKQQETFPDVSGLNSVGVPSLLNTGQTLRWPGPLSLKLSSSFCVLWWECLSFFSASLCIHVCVCRYLCIHVHVCAGWRPEVNIWCTFRSLLSQGLSLYLEVADSARPASWQASRIPLSPHPHPSTGITV